MTDPTERQSKMERTLDAMREARDAALVEAANYLRREVTDVHEGYYQDTCDERLLAIADEIAALREKS